MAVALGLPATETAAGEAAAAAAAVVPSVAAGVAPVPPLLLLLLLLGAAAAAAVETEPLGGPHAPQPLAFFARTRSAYALPGACRRVRKRGDQRDLYKNAYARAARKIK